MQKHIPYILLITLLTSVSAQAQSTPPSPWFGVDDNMPATENSEDIYIMGKVGIGTDNPAGVLNLSGNNTSIIVDRYTQNVASANMHLRSARGTAEYPSGRLKDDFVGTFNFHGYNDVRFTPSAQIAAVATEDHSAMGWGSNLLFNTVENGTGVIKNRMTIGNNGNIGVGTSSPNEILEITTDENDGVNLKIANQSGGSYASALMTLQSNHPARSTTIGVYSDNYIFSDWADSLVIQNNSVLSNGVKIVTNGSDFDVRTNHSPQSSILHASGSVGYIGIGTSQPQAKLDVQGSLKIGSGNEVCTSANAGMIQYNKATNKHQGCNGTSWNDLY